MHTDVHKKKHSQPTGPAIVHLSELIVKMRVCYACAQQMQHKTVINNNLTSDPADSYHRLSIGIGEDRKVDNTEQMKTITAAE